MNVTTKKSGDLNAVLTVNITPDDYSEKVDKVLLDYRKKANIPGFRPGKVPAGLIKKQYGKSILIEEVNHILQHAVYDHISKEKLDILGNPLPVAQEDIDWDTQTEFSFEFELGLAPEIDLTINDKIKVPYLKIEADKAMVDRYITDYTKRFGKMSQPETIGEDHLVKAMITEKGVEEGIATEATFSTSNVEDKKALKALVGKKVGEIVELKLKKIFSETFDVANLLKVEKDVLDAAQDAFDIEVLEITYIEPAALNQDLFDKVFGEGTISSEADFRARIKEDAEKMFVGESDRKFYDDVKDVVLSKTSFDLPDTFLKKWMQTSGEKPISAEEVEQEYPNMKDSMKWQLVESKVVKDNKIEVTQEELTDYTKNLVKNQMMQYGQTPEEADLTSIAQRVMENKEEVQRITDQLFGEKLMKFFKENLKVQEKKVSFDDFIKSMKK